MEAYRLCEREGIRSMDEEAYFNSVYSDTYPDVLKFVIIKTSRADQVDDILQNTYRNFYARILKRGYDDIGAPKAFIIRLAQKEISRHYKRKAEKRERETGLEDYDARIESDELSLARIVEDRDTLEAVRVVVAGMPLLSYKSFVLFYYYDMSIASIARHLGISENNVKNRLWRARIAVRKGLKGDYDGQRT
jgi:RNA polymerase sigma-70 factor (ECF subfamily)